MSLRALVSVVEEVLLRRHCCAGCLLRRTRRLHLNNNNNNNNIVGPCLNPLPTLLKSRYHHTLLVTPQPSSLLTSEWNAFGYSRVSPCVSATRHRQAAPFVRERQDASVAVAPRATRGIASLSARERGHLHRGTSPRSPQGTTLVSTPFID